MRISSTESGTVRMAEPATLIPTRGTVLVIDDDPNACDLMMRALAKEGFRVLVANNGPDGLKMARESHPNVITLDVLMPGMDGWAVIRALKADPELSSIPVIMITMADDRSLGLRAGRRRLHHQAHRPRAAGVQRRALSAGQHRRGRC